MRFNERALLVGKTRSGKTTFERYLLAHMRCRRILANVKGRMDVGVPPVSELSSIDWAAPVINWVPPSFDRRVFADFYMACWQHRGPPTVLADDELAAVTSPGYAPDGWLLIQQQGGEWDFGHINCAQRCKNIKMEARTEAEEFYIWCGLSQPDLDWLADEISEVDGQPFSGYDLRRRLEELAGRYPAPPGSSVASHAFLRWSRASGELDDCAPLDPGWVDAPLLQVARRSSRPSAPVEEPIRDADQVEQAEPN